MAYAEIAKPGVRVLRETVTAIDPEARRVTTDAGDARGRRARRRARRRLRLRRHARPARGRATSSTRWPAPNGWPRSSRRSPQGHAVIGVCGRAVQVPAGAERVRPAARRGAALARRARRLPDLLRDPAADAGAALAGGLRGAGSRVRRARHRADPRPPRQRARPRARRRRCSTTAASCPSTSSSACRSTARPRW